MLTPADRKALGMPSSDDDDIEQGGFSIPGFGEVTLGSWVPMVGQGDEGKRFLLAHTAKIFNLQGPKRSSNQCCPVSSVNLNHSQE